MLPQVRPQVHQGPFESLLSDLFEVFHRIFSSLANAL